MALMSVHVARREPVLGGRPFGAAGGYEKIDGTLRFGVDPMHPLHAEITDLDRAPRNGAGLVECAADFYLLRPRDGARGNGALLLDVPNRGRKLALAMFNSTLRAADIAGDIVGGRRIAQPLRRDGGEDQGLEPRGASLTASP